MPKFKMHRIMNVRRKVHESRDQREQEARTQMITVGFIDRLYANKCNNNKLNKNSRLTLERRTGRLQAGKVSILQSRHHEM